MRSLTLWTSAALAVLAVACSTAWHDAPGIADYDAGTHAEPGAEDSGHGDAPHAPRDAARDVVVVRTDSAVDGEGHGSDVDATGDGSTRGGGDGASVDASGACEVSGAPGTCISVSACASRTGYTSFAGDCPGPASIECCIVTPSTALNPPTPAGYVLMQQSAVTAAMTAWAVAILDDPTTYPMFSTTTQTFGTQLVLARVEWHPPDFQNSVVHRGVTLYVPT